MKREIVETQGAPRAIGPYSQAVRYGGLLFCSGQIAMEPVSGQVVTTEIRAQTERAMENLGAVLKTGGSSWDRVVKTTIFLTSMEDFAAMNEVYGRFFSTEPPARTTVAVASLPKGVLVEVEAVAACGD